jgi:adenosylcobinamide-GDP ribazoletransferase
MAREAGEPSRFSARDGTASGRRVPSPLIALEFLTVARLRTARVVSTEALAASQLWYPVVGLAIGLVLVAIDALLEGGLPAGPLAALLLVTLVGIPGLLHIDGLADSADGLLGQHERERRLEIMRDSRAGAFGVAAVALDLLLAFSAIAALRGPARTPALLIAPVAGRTAMVAVTAVFAYAREQGLGVGFHAAARAWPGRLALVSGVVLALALAGAGGLLLLAVAVAVALVVGLFAYRRLGGVTGDVIGAGCELGQTAALTAAGALQIHGWLQLCPYLPR